MFNKGPRMQKPHGYVEFPVKKNPKLFILIAVIVVALVCVGESFYSVKEQEQAILTMFGKVLRVDTAGLYFKVPFIQDVQKAFRDLAAPLRQEADKLGSTRHAEHARNLCDLLEKPLTTFDILKPDHRFGKYIRYALYEAVFLRETSRFPAVSLGTFGLALGGLAAAQDPEHASDHLTVWKKLIRSMLL